MSVSRAIAPTFSSEITAGYPENMTTELFAQFLVAKNRSGAIDLAHSNTSVAQNSEVRSFADRVLAGRSAVDAARYNKQSASLELLKIGHAAIFERMIGMDETNASNMAISPQTSTLLNKLILKKLHFDELAKLKQERGVLPTEFVALYPEGNFRYNHNNDGFSGVVSRVVKVDQLTKKITPETLTEAVRECEARGEKPLVLMLETPNNPWMAVYGPKELRQLSEAVNKLGLFVVNDMYLAGTEDIKHTQFPYVAYTTNPERVATTFSLRREFGFDDFGKVGFMCSHDSEFASAIRRSVTEMHIKHTVADTLISSTALTNLNPEDIITMRVALAAARSEAEELVKLADGIQVIVSAKAGPFITIGFTPEIESKLAELGIDDGYKAATYLAQTSGVLALPLCDMSTDVMGFRINIAYDRDTTLRGIEAIGKTIEHIKRGTTFADIKPSLDAIYADLGKSAAIPHK